MKTFFNYTGIVLKNAINNYSKLDEANIEFEQIFQGDIDGMLVVDKKYKIKRINKACLNLLGYTEEQLIGKPVNTLPQLASILKYIDFKSLKENHQETDVSFKHNENQTVIFCIVSISELRDNKKEPVGIIINLKDITERVNAKEKLRESEERFSLAIKGSNDGVWDWNIKTNEAFFSPQWKHMLGYGDNEIKNEFSELEWLIGEGERNKINEELNRIISGKDNRFEIEFKVKHKKGNWLNILSRAFVMDDADGNPIRVIGVNTDLTEIRNKEKELKIALEKAQESDKLKSAFLANMSHEIRTPMNGILGFSEMFLKPNLTNEKRKYYAKIVVDSGKRLMVVLNDILDLSRIETGRITLSITEVDLNSLISDLFAFFEPQANIKTVSLLPAIQMSNLETVILTDKDRLYQIFSNLISNALKFTHDGYIKFGYDIIDSKVVFFVEDTGIGIEKKLHDKIFERFRQVEIGITREYGGAGLGLSIAQKLVELLGGKIWLNSEIDKGSTFYFSLPYKVPSQKQLEEESSSLNNPHEI